MRYLRASRAQLRLWALLSLAFIIVGTSGGIAILKLATDRYTKDYRSELTNLASLASLSVDATEHSKLENPEQMDSELYRKQVQALADVKQRIEGVRYIYTLRSTPAGFCFILDPTPPGDHDNDGQDDKSYLGDPYPEVSMAARSAYEQGKVTVELEPTTDRWGTFVSSYAPIKDHNGKVVAILGIDRLANDIVEHQRDLQNVVIGGAIMIILMGSFFGWAFTRKMTNSADNRGWLRYLTGSNRIFRATILEVVLGSAALIVFLGAIQSLSSQSRSANDLRQSLARAKDLHELESEIASSGIEAPDRAIRIAKLIESAQRHDIAWAYERLVELQGESKADEPLELARLSRELGQQVRAEFAIQSTARRDIDEHHTTLTVLFFLSAFLALGTLAVVRTASIQQQDLIAAQTDSEWHQVAYRQVVENLPVGLYMYSDGELTFSNTAWDDQCQRRPREDRLAALMRSLPEAEQSSFLKTLEDSSSNRSAFESTYKIVTDTGQTLVMETQGIPLFNGDGEFECLLGFSIDVTQKARAQDLLRGKNREVQSKNRMLSRAITDLEENFEAMIQTLVKAVEAKDIYTAGHSERVMEYSIRIGRTMGLTSADLRTLQMGALIHDIGKIGIPDDILIKPSGLTEDEYKIIQSHPSTGARMIEGIPVFQDCVPIIRSHHERLNGSGYPDGLMADEIPIIVRIAAVADVFDALTSSRAYRSAMKVDEALSVLTTMADSNELDPEVVSVLTEIVMVDGTLWHSDVEQAA